MDLLLLEMCNNSVFGGSMGTVRYERSWIRPMMGLLVCTSWEFQRKVRPISYDFQQLSI